MRMPWVTAVVVAFTVAGGIDEADAYYFDGSRLLEVCESNDMVQLGDRLSGRLSDNPP